MRRALGGDLGEEHEWTTSSAGRRGGGRRDDRREQRVAQRARRRALGERARRLWGALVLAHDERSEAERARARAELALAEETAFTEGLREELRRERAASDAILAKFESVERQGAAGRHQLEVEKKALAAELAELREEGDREKERALRQMYDVQRAQVDRRARAAPGSRGARQFAGRARRVTRSRPGST